MTVERSLVLYSVNELDDKARARAIVAEREVLGAGNWWDHELQEARVQAKALGFDIKKNERTGAISIWFQDIGSSWAQISFDATWEAPFSHVDLDKCAGSDDADIAAIAGHLTNATMFGVGYGEVVTSWPYSGQMRMSTSPGNESFRAAVNALCEWILKQIEAAFEAIEDDDEVARQLDETDALFFSDGTRVPDIFSDRTPLEGGAELPVEGSIAKRGGYLPLPPEKVDLVDGQVLSELATAVDRVEEGAKAWSLFLYDVLIKHSTLGPDDDLEEAADLFADIGLMLNSASRHLKVFSGRVDQKREDSA